MIVPRLYQQEWAEGILAEYAKGVRRTAGVMATGGGKTPSAMLIARLALQAGKPVLWLAHRRELIGQAIDKARDVAPEYRVGKLLGTTKQYRAEIVVGSIQTASTDTTLNLLASRVWGLIVIDECFPAGTLIDGRPIESLRPGDVVRSYDEATGAVVARRVAQTMQRAPSAMVRVTLSDGTHFECTPNHPILTPLGWLPAEQLHGAYVVSYARDTTAGESGRVLLKLRGDGAPARAGEASSAPDDDGLCRDRRSITRSAGSPGGRLASPESAVFTRVDRVEILEPGRDGTYGGVCPDGLVYNFEVEGTHTYLVGDAGLVAHNCHHVAAPTYQKLLKRLRAFEPDGPLMLGVTATLDRSDGLALGDTFETVASPRFGLIDLIRYPRELGGPFLVPPRGIRVKIQELDLDRIGRVAGDFKQAALGAALSAAMAPQKIVEAWTEHAKGRPTIAFLPTKLLSAEVAGAFNEAGYRAVHLDDSTPATVRDEALKAFRAGKIDLLCNVGLFTEGTDLPMCSCVILARITSSGTLYQQMVGRGLRIHPGKTDCVILDVSGVTSRHRIATLVNLGGADSPEDIPDDLLMYEEDEEAVQAALEEVESTDTTPVIEYADGELEHELIDLFGQSHSAWLRTDGGAWFLPAGPGGFVFLRPTATGDRYDVCTRPDGPRARARTVVLHTDMEIGYAMAAGDAYVASYPMWQTERSAAWRAERVRGATRGEKWDAERRQRASAALDPV